MLATSLLRLRKTWLVDDLVGQQVGVARVLDADLAEHLAEDQLDVLVVDAHALGAVDVLHLVEHVGPQRLLALDPQDVVRDERALGAGSPAWT
jgi:hypothetical protein